MKKVLLILLSAILLITSLTLPVSAQDKVLGRTGNTGNVTQVGYFSSVMNSRFVLLSWMLPSVALSEMLR